MSLNTKLIYIDTDRAVPIVAVQNPTISNISFYAGNEYILTANTYANASSSNVASFDINDDWEIYIGRQYETNASPVVIITDPTKFNNTSDWSSANVSTGQICARVNVNGTALIVDIANNDSQSYTFEWICINNVSAQVMVMDTNVIINNAVQI